MPIPASFRRAEVRSVFPVEPKLREFGLAFDLDGGPDFGGETLRLRLHESDLPFLIATLTETHTAHALLQSERSSGSPSLLESAPEDGQKVCPPTKSESASEGVAYAPSGSSSHPA